MSPALARVLLVLRGYVPAAAALAAVLLAVLPFGVPRLAVVTPFFALIVVYYWSVYRPDLLPVWAVFLLGLCQDVLTGAPTGLVALVLVLVHALAVSQRRVLLGQTFAVEWAGFLLVAGGATTLAWLLASLWHTALLGPMPFAIQASFTVALYPLGAWLLAFSARLARPAGLSPSR